MKLSIFRAAGFVFVLPVCAFASNNVVNLSHYDLMHPDFVGMKNEGIVGVIHEATYPRFDRDSKYRDRQMAALQAGLLWGAYHFGDATDPVRQADHFLSVVAASVGAPIGPEKRRPGILLVLDFERNGHYPGGTMTVAKAVAFVERIRERTGKYPGLYCSEYRLRQMLYGSAVTMGLLAPLAVHGRWQVRSSAQHVSKKGRQHSQRRAEYFPRRQRRVTTLLARTRLVSDRIESTNSVAAAGIATVLVFCSASRFGCVF